MSERAELRPRTDLGPGECGPGCPHCHGSMHACRECHRQYAELRLALGAVGDEVSNIDLHRILHAVRAVDVRVLSREKGNWAPALPLIREAYGWLRRDQDDLEHRPRSKRPAFYRPLERWREHPLGS